MVSVSSRQRNHVPCIEDVHGLRGLTLKIKDLSSVLIRRPFAVAMNTCTFKKKHELRPLFQRLGPARFSKFCELPILDSFQFSEKEL